MMTPQVVGVLLKKPGQKHQYHLQQGVGDGDHPKIPPLDPQETKIRGELYVENLGERRFVSIRMGWLWVEGTPMRLALRALNLRQAEPSICQPHTLALGFILSNSRDHTLATFWADTEPIWWSWVRAIAAEIVRQTPFRAQRCLNFLGILTTCPRGPIPLPDSPTEQRRRSRSELRCWPTTDLTIEKITNSVNSPSILEDSRRRSHSELRGWSSSNSSDDDVVLGRHHGVSILVNANNRTNSILMQSRAWGCSESSEGSDDSLPYGAGSPCSAIVVESVDCVDAPAPVTEPTTREQRMQRYKEARRRENEARRRQVMEEDARRRKASRAEENNNDILYRCTKIREKMLLSNESSRNEISTPTRETVKSPKKDYVPSPRLQSSTPSVTIKRSTTATSTTETPIKKLNSVVEPIEDVQNTVRFEDTRQTSEDDYRNNNRNNARNNIQININLVTGVKKPGILRTNDSNERRSRARERRCVRERNNLVSLPAVITNNNINDTITKSIETSKEHMNGGTTTIPTSLPEICTKKTQLRSSSVTATPLTTLTETPREEDVARLLERCQRVDHYVPVREKLTLFESLSKMGGRLARSTEDLGRSSANPTPKGKQRARSLHDLNRGGAKSLPVKEMCRFFENDKPVVPVVDVKKIETTRSRFSDSPRSTCRKEYSPKNPNAPCIRTSTRRKHYAK